MPHRQVRVPSIAATPRCACPRSESHPFWICVVLYMTPFSHLSYVLLSFFRVRPPTPYARFCAPLVLLPSSHYSSRAYIIPLSSPWPKRPSMQVIPFSFRLRAAASLALLTPATISFRAFSNPRGRGHTTVHTHANTHSHSPLRAFAFPVDRESRLGTQTIPRNHIGVRLRTCLKVVTLKIHTPPLPPFLAPEICERDKGLKSRKEGLLF
jgi:hypothetical protein